ncbi:MAG: hypothetical protein AAGG51_06910 [Cyanobacteria bacterium P01_G01_bin.54]
MTHASCRLLLEALHNAGGRAAKVHVMASHETHHQIPYTGRARRPRYGFSNLNFRSAGILPATNQSFLGII